MQYHTVPLFYVRHPVTDKSNYRVILCGELLELFLATFLKNAIISAVGLDVLLFYNRFLRFQHSFR